MLNKVMLIGRLGRDPELRYTQNGTPVTTLNIATDESYTDREGNRVERTEWHRVTVFQRQAENCATYLGKGSLVFVEGSLQTRKWQDQQGMDRYTTEIKAQRVQFLDRRNSRQGQDGENGGYQPRASQGEGGYQPRQPYGRAPQGRPGGQDMGHGQPAQRRDEDMGPAFPSEAGSLDEVPF